MKIGSASHPMLVNISQKFHEDVLKGFNVIEWTHTKLKGA